MLLTRIFDWFLRKLYPPRCIFCGDILNDDVKLCVCRECAVSVERVPFEHCPVCGRVTELGGNVCWKCSSGKIPFKSHRSVYYYNGKARRAVIKLKFHDKPQYAQTMGKLMSAYAPKAGDIDIVTYVPMTVKAVKKRGYNQSKLLAENISECIGAKCDELLSKNRDTNVQSTLKFSQRQKNILGAFKACADVKGKRILLVDDVFTTGATISECAKVLKRAGAKEIYCLTFAMTKGFRK